MQYEVVKSGCDFKIVSDDGVEANIINQSNYKFIKSLFNWFVSDFGFTYRLTYKQEVFILRPLFGGRGYKLESADGSEIGIIQSNWPKPPKLKIYDNTLFFEDGGNNTFIGILNGERIANILYKLRVRRIVFSGQEQPSLLAILFSLVVAW